MNKLIPCGGFYYDDNVFAFTEDVNGYITIKKKPILEKVADYLYYTTYDSYDYKDGNKYMERFHYMPSCSAIRKGDFVAGNLDWYYEDRAEVVVETKACNGRYATIGIVHSGLTNEQCESGEYSDYYNAMPFMTNVCINSKGVVAKTNVVTAGEKGLTLGTNKGKPDLCSLMIPRFVCDYADSAKHAIELLENMNIYAPLNIVGYDCHIMLCDGVDSYIIEFVDNKMVVLSTTDDDYDEIPNDMNIMTNFHLDGWNGDIKAVFMGDTKQEVEATGLTPYSMGLERYEILSDLYDGLTDEADFAEAMEAVKFTNAYNESQDPFWYSEFCDGDLTIYSEDSDFTEIVDEAINAYEHRTRDGKTWYTAHTFIYDIENRKLSVYVGEDFDNKYEFKLNVVGIL